MYNDTKNIIFSVPKLTLGVGVKLSGCWLLDTTFISFLFYFNMSTRHRNILESVETSQTLNNEYDITGTDLSPESKVMTEFSSGRDSR